jgi:hypothetical protein
MHQDTIISQQLSKFALLLAKSLDRGCMNKSQVENGAKNVGRRAAVIGYLAKGILWFLMGGLTLQAALGMGSARVDQNVVLLRLFAQPFGKYTLIVLAIGLGSYAVWRVMQAFFDPDNQGKDFIGIVNRASYVVTGLGYIGMAFAAFELSTGSGSGGGSEQITRVMTARILTYPLGSLLVGLVGAFITGLGLYQIYLGYSTRFEHAFEEAEMTPEERRWAIHIGRFGFISRSIVFSVIGIIFIHAAIRYEPHQVGFFGQALRSLSEQPYGVYIIGVLGLGLMAYGVYSMVLARYRRIDW